jgi:hypothetical protein
MAVSFAASLWLSYRGLSPVAALLAASTLSVCTGVAIVVFRESFRVRRLFSRCGRHVSASLMVAGAALDLARRSNLKSAMQLPPDLLSELFLAGVSLMAVTACICLAAAHRSDRVFCRVGARSWITILVAAIGIARPSMSPGLLALGLVLPWAPIMLRKGSRGSPLAQRVVLTVFVAVCAWKTFYPSVLWIDNFEDGHSLAAAQSYLNGAQPYRDVVPIHGWGADGGIDAFVFRRGGATLHTFFLRHAIWATGALLLLGWACVAALGSDSWGCVAFFFALSICPVPFDRQTLAFASLLLLCLGARTQRRGVIVAAGVVAGFQVLYSVEYGVIVAVGGLLGLLLLRVLDRVPGEGRRSSSLKDFRAFVGGILCGTLPFLALLSLHGSLLDFLRNSFIEMPRWATEAWGYPAPDLWKTLMGIKTAGDLAAAMASSPSPLFVLALMALAGAVLFVRGGAGSFDSIDRGALMAWAVAAVAMRVVLGRADGPHLMRYGLFVAIPAAWLVLRAWRSGRSRSVLVLTVVAFLSCGLHPVQALEKALAEVETAASKTRDGRRGALAPRSGASKIIPQEAASLEEFRRYADANLGPNQTFFDFANQPGLYFTADRLLPIRYLTVAQYESADRQTEVIRDLERRKPPIAILPAGQYGQLDGITNSERAPEVARYLDEHYEFDREVGGYRLAKRRSLSVEPRLIRRIDP